MKKFIALSLLAAAALMPGEAASKPKEVYRDSSAPVEQRVTDLLSRMTLDEKIGQLNHRSMWEGGNEYMGKEVAAGTVGAILNALGAESADYVQRCAVEKSRLGIPVIVARDVIHGYKTILPIPLGQAASFNPALAEAGARAAAVEASSDGIRWTYAPMLDISRDPRWGRMAESCGEDPYLSAEMGAAMVRGFQGNDLTASSGEAACAKHFMGYGASEAGRDYNSTYIPERNMRNVYMQPFERAVKEGCLTFMTSFNDNDGVPSSGNAHILRDILRGEWGFDGMVVSDWNSIGEMIAHGFCADKADAARRALTAGVDMDMEGTCYIENNKHLLKEGRVSMKD